MTSENSPPTLLAVLETIILDADCWRFRMGKSSIYFQHFYGTHGSMSVYCSMKPSARYLACGMVTELLTTNLELREVRIQRIHHVVEDVYEKPLEPENQITFACRQLAQKYPNIVFCIESVVDEDWEAILRSKGDEWNSCVAYENCFFMSCKSVV